MSSRDQIARHWQNLMSQILYVEDGEIIGTGKLSYAIADIIQLEVEAASSGTQVDTTSASAASGTGFQAGPIGNRTAAHLNLTTPLQPIPKPSIAITRGKKK